MFLPNVSAQMVVKIQHLLKIGIAGYLLKLLLLFEPCFLLDALYYVIENSQFKSKILPFFTKKVEFFITIEFESIFLHW